MRDPKEILDRLCILSKIKKEKYKHMTRYQDFIENHQKLLFAFSDDRKYIDKKIDNLEEKILICNTAMNTLYWVLGGVQKSENSVLK